MHLLEFTEKAQKQFNKLDSSVRKEVANALSRRLRNPRMSSSRLRGNLAGLYKIKLVSLRLRVIYKVIDDRMIVLVVSIGKRENGDVYKSIE